MQTLPTIDRSKPEKDCDIEGTEREGEKKEPARLPSISLRKYTFDSHAMSKNIVKCNVLKKPERTMIPNRDSIVYSRRCREEQASNAKQDASSSHDPNALIILVAASQGLEKLKLTSSTGEVCRRWMPRKMQNGVTSIDP